MDLTSKGALALSRAHDEAVKMRESLECTIALLYAERPLIGLLDSDGLMRSATERQVQQSNLARAAKAFNAAIEEARDVFSAGEPSLDGLHAHAPLQVVQVRATLEEVSQLAEQHQREEATQTHLIARAKDCIDGYLSAISPRTQAYDARGMARTVAYGRARTQRVV